MNRRGFTLVELLVVIGIMAMLSTVSVAGYFAAVRGMTERGAIQDTISLLRMAQQRALIDQVPTAVIFYNQKLSDGNEFEEGKVGGFAVAIRMAGRISYKDDSAIVDEFADWDRTYPPLTTGNANDDPPISLYRMVKVSESQPLSACRMLAQSSSVKVHIDNEYMIGLNMQTNVVVYGLAKHSRDDSSFNWNVGDAYGVEIGSMQLPADFIYGNRQPSGESSSVAGIFFFDPSDSSNFTVSGNKYVYFTSSSFGGIEISAMRSVSGARSLVKVEKIEAEDVK